MHDMEGFEMRMTLKSQMLNFSRYHPLPIISCLVPIGFSTHNGLENAVFFHVVITEIIPQKFTFSCCSHKFPSLLALQKNIQGVML